MSKLSDIFKKLLDGGRFTEWADDNKITQYDTFDELDNLLADRARVRNRALPYILGLGGVSALPAFLSGYNNQPEV